MKVKILRTCAARGQHLEVGSTVELDDRVARELINCRRAVALGADVETRDPHIAIGDASEVVMTSKRGRK